MEEERRRELRGEIPLADRVSLEWKDICLYVPQPKRSCTTIVSVLDKFQTQKVQFQFEEEDLGLPQPVTKRFNGASFKRILTNQNGRVMPGELVAIMGPSGSGKTSVLNVLS